MTASEITSRINEVYPFSAEFVTMMVSIIPIEVSMESLDVIIDNFRVHENYWKAVWKIA